MSRQFLTRAKRYILEGKGTLAILMAAIIAGSFYLSRTITVRQRAMAQTAVIPFVLDMEAYNFEDIPEGELTGRRTIARRSDGSTVATDSTLGRIGLQYGLTTRKIQFTDGRIIVLFDWLRAKSTWRQTPEALAGLKATILHPPENCVFGGNTLLGYDKLLGQEVAIVKSPPGAGASTHWRAVGLGCRDLLYRHQTFQPDGSLRLTAETRTVRLKLEDPDPGLFDEGASYEEVPPSEALRRGAKSVGVPWDESMQQWGERADEGYFKAKSHPVSE